MEMMYIAKLQEKVQLGELKLPAQHLETRQKVVTAYVERI